MVPTTTIGKDCREMILIPAGPFWMGSEEFGPETPLHQVFLPDYYIDKFPVTNLDYKKYMLETRARPPRHWKGFEIPPGLEKHSVHRITWYEACAYTEWAEKRLPTEAEWEKACRGTDGRRWPWGNEFNEDYCLVWDSGTFLDTVPVDTHPAGASPYGVYEMVGNVEEWTADWYDAFLDSTYHGKAFGKIFKTLKGGSSFFTQNHARCAYRCFTRPEDDGIDGLIGVGFRCVLDISAE